MTRWKIGTATVCLGLLLASGARADLPWLELNLGPHVGLARFDETLRVGDGAEVGGRLGLTFWSHLGIEATYGEVSANGELDPDSSFPVTHFGADLVFNIFPQSKINPYLTGGWAQLNLDEQPGDISLRLAGREFGGGVKIAMLRRPGVRVDLRLDGRQVVATNDRMLTDVGKRKHHTFLTAGVSVAIISSDADTDKDGVVDRFDRCPSTPRGARVDPFGCPLDYDGDGAYDGLDECPFTPVGALVDSLGCPSDSDGDGVLDGLDYCEDTPPGVKVDIGGCAMDTDGDGVFDGYDKCPATPAGIKVDAFGCPFQPISRTESEFLDTGKLVLENVYFDSGSAALDPRSFGPLDEIGRILVKWPQLEIEVGGHTDSHGSDANNKALSQRRAQSVMDYLSGKFRELQVGQFRIVGYGEAQPVAENTSSAGRARNRRVEFKILNRGVLRK